MNAITEIYCDTILASDRRHVLTRAKLLEMIGKTEDSIKNGCTVADVLPFFEHFKIPIRLFDYLFKCIFRYDPQNVNYHNKAFYALVKDDHIYNLRLTSIFKFSRDSNLV